MTKSGVARQQAQLSLGEQLAKTLMRRRARESILLSPSLSVLDSDHLLTVHYVETRGDLDLKVARVNRRLMKVQEGDHVSFKHG